MTIHQRAELAWWLPPDWGGCGPLSPKRRLTSASGPRSTLFEVDAKTGHPTPA